MPLSDDVKKNIASQPEAFYLTARSALDNQTENYSDEEENNLLETETLARAYLPSDYGVTLMNSISADDKAIINKSTDNAKTVFLNAQNALNKGGLSLEEAKEAYAYKSYAENALRQSGENPQDLLKPDTGWERTKSAVYNTLNLGTNLVAKAASSMPYQGDTGEDTAYGKVIEAWAHPTEKLFGKNDVTEALDYINVLPQFIENYHKYAGDGNRDTDPSTNWFQEFWKNWKDSDIKLWGGAGWSDYLTQEALNGTSSQYGNVLEKIAAGDPLTDDEQEIYKTVNRMTNIGGLVGDVFLDPFNAIGYVGKLTRAGETAKDASKIIETMRSTDAFADTLNSARTIGSYIARNADEASDLGKLGKNLANIQNVGQLYKATDTGVDFVDDIAKLSELSPDAAKALNNLKMNDLHKFKVISSPFARYALGYDLYIGVKKTGEAISNLPGLRNITKIVSDAPLALKNMFDNARSVKNYMTNFGGATADNVMIQTHKLAKKMGSVDDANRLVTELVERPIAWVDATKKATQEQIFNEAKSIADGIRSASDRIFMEEVATAGHQVIPMGLLDGLEGKSAEKALENWNILADSYRDAYKLNPYSDKTRELGDTIRAMNSTTSDGLSYFAHTTSEEAADFLRNLKGNAQGKSNVFGEDFDPSWLRRSQTGLSIQDINDVVYSGDPDAIRAIFSSDMAKTVIDFTEAYPGAKFFTDAPEDIIRLRANRAGRVMTQATLRNQIVDFIQNKALNAEDYFFKTQPKAGYTLSDELSDLVFGKGRDVSQRIYIEDDLFKTMGEWGNLTKPYFNNSVIQSAVHVWDEMNRFLRKTFLVSFPSYHVRNEIGNAYALALGGALTPADTATALKLMTWAKNPEKLKNFKIISKSGAIYTGEDILNMAQKTDVIGTTRNMVENAAGSNIASNIIGGWRKITKSAEGATIPGKIANKTGEVIEGLMDASPWNAILSSAGSALENHARLTMFVNRLRGGDTVLDAAADVKKYLFDYSDLSTFETNVVKRVAFFYTWARKNLFLQLGNITSQLNRNILKTSEAINQSGGLMNFFQQAPTPVVEERYQSDYLGNLPKVTLSVDPTGRKASYWSLANFIPSMDVFEPVIAAQKEGGAGALFRNIAEGFTPLLRIPLELGANRSFFTDSTIEDYPGEKSFFLGMSIPARAAYVLKNISRAASLANSLTAQNKRLSLFGRARPTPAIDTKLKILKSLIGTPLQYDTDFSRIFKASTAGDVAYEKLGSIFSTVMRLENYEGEEIPRKDIQDAVDELRAVYQFIQEEGAYGGLSNEAQLNNYVQSVADSIVELIEKYGGSVDEF